MKVICINSKPFNNSVTPEKLKLISEGMSYIVSNISSGYDLAGNIHKIYDLEGIDTFPAGFSACRFLPVSDIDETELVNEDIIMEKV